MPPNLKYPHNLAQQLAAAAAFQDDDLPLEHTAASSSSIIPPAHDAAPLATNADIAGSGGVVIPATIVHDISQGDDGYFHHDIEADTHDDGNKKTVEDKPAEEQEDEHKIVRTILRKFSSIVRDPEELTIDEKRLQHALKDAGTHAYGLQGIAVWIFDEDHDRLVAPPGGFWCHPTNTRPSEALEGLMDSHHSSSDHVPMVPVAPGTDIAGLLWLESSSHHYGRVSLFIRRATSGTQLAQHNNKRSTDSLPHLQHTKESSIAAPLTWRDLNSLVQDPDTAKGPRLVLLEKAGFGQATGIPFSAGHCAGMVIFFVQKNLDADILNGAANVSYLRQSAQFIGAAAAMTEARRATVGQQRSKRGRPSTITPVVVNVDGKEDTAPHEQSPNDVTKDALDDEGDGEEPKSVSDSCCDHIPKRIHVWLSKTKGGGLQIPPTLSFRQALWTAFGAFCGLLVLSALNEYYMYLSDDEYYLMIGPFGALITLQYGLTAAPASQPRNAVMGQAVAGAISLAFTYIPEEILATWIRRAVGPAIAIATMVKLGFTHPPAGAHAVLYASGNFNFAFYALVVLSTVISIIPATLINNMSRKRQYPTYWGVPAFVTDAIASCLQKSNKS